MKRSVGIIVIVVVLAFGFNVFVNNLPISSQNNTAQVSSGGAPVAQFSVSCPALQCTFNASSSTGTSIISYSWNWGTGQAVEVKSGYTAVNTFTAGTYTVTLTVTDSVGRTGSISQSVTVGGAN